VLTKVFWTVDLNQRETAEVSAQVAKLYLFVETLIEFPPQLFLPNFCGIPPNFCGIPLIQINGRYRKRSMSPKNPQLWSLVQIDGRHRKRNLSFSFLSYMAQKSPLITQLWFFLFLFFLTRRSHRTYV